ncbi:alpha/beta fold hydrolase [Streptomyces smyrnaeus]|uniref:alpha/beta fold hydrolase n=1 Tax=Streptomyces smyrnaeus TaxID=1387713 RepID=UPI0036CC192A
MSSRRGLGVRCRSSLPQGPRRLLGRRVLLRSYGGDPSDAFHVVAPPVPGSGFSRPTRDRGWGTRRIARAWAELMRRLGYPRYGAQGGDFGSMISPELGRTAPDHGVDVHVNALVNASTPADLDEMALLPGAEREQALETVAAPTCRSGAPRRRGPAAEFW